MSERGLKDKKQKDSLIETGEQPNYQLSEHNRYLSEYKKFAYSVDMVKSINKSISVDNESQQDEVMSNHEFIKVGYNTRTSRTSNLEDSEYESSSPFQRNHIASLRSEKSRSLERVAESGDDSFILRPDIEPNLRHKQSSSIVSSSKTSVGFLKDFYFQLVELIKFRSLDRLGEELTNSDDVYGPIDMTRKIILHYAGEFNSIEIGRIIFDGLFLDNPTKTNIKLSDWINSANSDGLCPIHFAAYRGNNQLISYLISLGANVKAIDKDGHNCIHIAAQADKINTIYFLLKNYKFDINQGDKKLSTALHWSAFLNKENALTYLLAWGANPNLQDVDKNTPLHLSVILSCRTANTRNVKLLLLKGASRDALNNDEYKPIDLINPESKKATELRSLLGKSTFLSCGMLRPPLTKLEKNEKTVIFFLFLLSTLTLLSFGYVQPVYDTKIIPIISGALLVFLMISFGLVTIKDPGYLKKEKALNFQELLDTLDPLDICPECEIILTPRGRHGNIGNKGVERFDHHCPYINNGVGYNNHSYFLFYILAMFSNLCYQFVITIIAIAIHDNKGLSLFSFMVSKPMFFVSSIITLCTTGLFLLPVLFLLIVHTTNFLK